VLEELMPEVSTGRTALKFILFCTAAVLLILAVARPQFGSKLREEKAQGVEMMLVVDVSNSMLAEDFEPNRLERTKYAINKLFDGLRQDRVGLIVFAGEPKVQLPITSDYRMAKAFAKRIDPSLVSVQGTAIGKALSQALLSFSGETEETHSRVIILVTDGENHEDDALAVAKRAAEMGIRIYTIGIGTPEGAPHPDGGGGLHGREGGGPAQRLRGPPADLDGGRHLRGQGGCGRGDRPPAEPRGPAADHAGKRRAHGPEDGLPDSGGQPGVQHHRLQVQRCGHCPSGGPAQSRGGEDARAGPKYRVRPCL